MKKSTIIFLLFLVYLPLNSQGFNWQYSTRLPHSSPKFFLGTTFSFSYLNSNGEFPFVEDRFTCCDFESGNGTGLYFGLSSEYWFKPLRAFRISFGYYQLSSDFSQNKEYPVIIDNATAFMEQYKYDYDALMRYISSGIGYKIKFQETQFSLIGTLNFSYLFSESNSSTESRTGPTDRVPTYTRTIPEGKIQSIRNFYVAPEISFGYDLNLGNGMYSTVQIQSEIPLLSMTDNSNWRKWQFSLGISVFRGIKLN